MLRPSFLLLLAGVSARLTGLQSAAAAEAAAPAVWSPAQFGAKLDGATNDRAALQRAIDQATRAGGGIVELPAGRTLLTGSFELKSNVTLQLDAGSRILASTRREDYDTPCLVRA
jgi:polygalacturonase